MSKVKINNAEFQEIQKYVDNAKLLSEEANEKIWGENFDNLYNNFVTNGFLNDLYKDAESKFNLIFGGSTGLLCGAGAAISGTAAAGVGVGATVASVAACIPVAGWIIAAVILGILAIVGIYHVIKSASSVQFKHDAEKVFVDLLTECVNGTHPVYLSAENVNTKLQNCRLSLQQILLKIDEFNTQYANLNATASDMGVKTTLASDGVTVLSIDTEVTIDGQQVTLSTTEAMGAFFTYTNTVMSGEIAADYLHRTYGYDINFTDIVKNANAFMTNTIKSGLYSHEFITGLLPTYTPSLDGAYDAITGATGIDLDKIKSALENNGQLAGSLALFGGLLGTALIGNMGGTKTPEPTPTPNGGGSGGGGTSGGSPSGGGGTSGGGTGGGTVPVTPTPTPTPEPEPEPEPTPEPEPEPVPDPKKNDIEIEPISEFEIPDPIEPDFGEKDYDMLAREQFEFEQDFDEIMAHRSEIADDVMAKFAEGKIEDIKSELSEYGYNKLEIDNIIKDEATTIKAILEGEQNVVLLQKAMSLAKADGVDNYNSSYAAAPDYDKLVENKPNRNYILASEDDDVRESYENRNNAKDTYKKVVEDTNKLYKELEEKEAAMNEIKENYVEEYGEDTTEWPEEAVNEYNASIKDFNESVENVEEQEKLLTEAKEGYEKACEDYENARETFYKELEEKLNSNGDGTVVLADTDNALAEQAETSLSPDDIAKQIDSSIKLDGQDVIITSDVIQATENREKSIEDQINSAVGSDGQTVVIQAVDI